LQSDYDYRLPVRWSESAVLAAYHVNWRWKLFPCNLPQRLEVEWYSCGHVCVL